jgi:hypothetical protein
VAAVQSQVVSLVILPKLLRGCLVSRDKFLVPKLSNTETKIEF